MSMNSLNEMIHVDAESYFNLLNEVKFLRQQNRDLQAAGTAMVETRRNESITYNVEAFHRKYGHPVSYVPHVPTTDLVRQRLSLMSEEFYETLVACCSLHHSQICNLEMSKHGVTRFIEGVHSSDVDLVEFADGLCDQDFINEGTRLVFGVPRVKVLEEVMRSNMDKLPNGQNKPIKPPDWTPPNIERVLLEAGWQK